MEPKCDVTINGNAVSGDFNSRLISCDVTDKEGVSSDTARLVLNNSPAVSIPQTGDMLRIWMGYSRKGMVFMGTFVIDEVEVRLFSHTISISAKAADMRDGVKENKERHWDDATVQDIVSDIARDQGLSAKVDGEFAGFTYDWFGQQDESDMHVLSRLEQRHGGLFSVKDGMLIFAKRGSGTTPSGAALSAFTVTQNNIIEGSGSVRFTDRAKFKEVRAYHQDRDELERQEEAVVADDDAQAIYRMGEPFGSKDEAKAAAIAKSKELQRQAASFSCNVVGNPAARAGAPLVFSGMRVGIDGETFIIETAAHSFSKSGYTTSLSGKRQVE